MAKPIWNEKEQRWVLRVTSNRVEKKFTSIKKGVAGKRAVLDKYHEWENNGSVKRNKATVNQVWELFEEDVRQRNGAQSEAIYLYSKIGRLYILPAIGKKRVDSLMKNDYQQIINTAKPHNKRTTCLSKKYLSSIRMVINLFVKFSNENGYSEPFLGTLYIPKGHPTVGKEILQPDEIKRLFEPSDKHYHKAICFMVASGLRPSEVLGLKWSDIDRDYFTIQRGINSKGKITEGKNENAHRRIPLNKILIELLQAQKQATEHLNSEWIFCSIVGAAGSQSTLSNHLRELGEERGFNVSPYCLRHTFISMCKYSMPEQMIKSIVGHSVSMDTYGVYGHEVDGEMKQAAEIIDLTFKQLEEQEYTK